jgi:hypothetical protein
MTNNGDNAVPQDVKRDRADNSISGGWLFAIGVLTTLLLLVVGWMGFWIFHLYTDRAKFIADGSLNVLILAAILLQVYIYFRQRDVMKQQWQAMQAGLERTDRVIEKMQSQLDEVQKQSGLMESSLAQTRTLVEQNERAVKAAEANVKTVEKTSIYANRAYLSVAIEKIEESFQFHLRVDNSGNTPAINVLVWFNCRMADKPPYDVENGRVTAYDNPDENRIGLGLIANAGSQRFQTPKRNPQFLEGEWNKWQLGQIQYYCWGRIYYRTIFDEDRHTDFCFFQKRGFPNGFPCEYRNEAI